MVGATPPSTASRPRRTQVSGPRDPALPPANAPEGAADPTGDAQVPYRPVQGQGTVRDEQVLVQFVTRVPKGLHRDVKVHCAEWDCSVMQFVVGALREALDRESLDHQRSA